MFTLTATGYNLVRLTKLVPAEGVAPPGIYPEG
jgi:hypothetical protein